MFRLVQRHVGAKIALGYLIALALTIAISVLAIVWLGQISSTLDDLTRHLTMDQDLADAIAR